MFSLEEKNKIAAAVEKALLEIGHPEMPEKEPYFELHVKGKAPWSFADIKPNWTYDTNNAPTTTTWNENSKQILKDVK